MEKIEIVKHAEDLLPEEIVNGTISLNGQILPLREYMEKYLISIVKETTSPEYLASIVVTRFRDKIKIGKSDEDKIAAIDNFLNSLYDKKEEIRLSEETTINIREYMIANALPYMDNELFITVGPNKKNIEQFYLTILANEYQPLTKAEKAETCLYFMGFLSKEVLDSLMVGTNITVRDYISTELPEFFINSTDVSIAGEIMRVDECIKRIERKQLEMMEDSIELPGLKPEEVSYGNPLRVGEITYSMSPDHSIKVSTDTPFIPLPELTDEERYNVIFHENNHMTITREALLDRLNNLFDATRKVTSAHDLEFVENELQEIRSELENLADDIYVAEKYGALERAIQERKHNLIKSENNKEDYIDAVQGRITTLKERLRDCQELEVFDQVYGEMMVLHADVLEKGITDFQLHATIDAFIKDITFRRLKTDSLIRNQSKDIERLKNQIDDYIRTIKQDVYYMEAENKLSSITGVQIRIERAYNETLSVINDAYRDGFLTREESEYYKTMLDGAIGVTKEENRKNM